MAELLLTSKTPQPIRVSVMAFWKENPDSNAATAKTNPGPAPVLKEIPRSDFATQPEVSTMPDTIALKSHTAASPSSSKESLIASDITIEGKIEGAGSVRIAGKFKGDVNVQGDLTIESGAKLAGSVRANQVSIAGELEGNIESATRVDLLQTGVMAGDVKAGSLTVASGARMRGQAIFGWEDERITKSGKNDKVESTSSAA
jgi:cytoskeletal protein CcmA (bactofilin family)